MNHLLTMTLGIALGATLAAASINKKVPTPIEQKQSSAVYYTTKPAGADAPSESKPKFRF